MEEIKKSSEIKVTIGLNEEQMPVSISWQSDSNPNGAEPQECKGMLLSLFDREHRETLKVDLWTKDMQVVEMDRFFYQTLRAMADTYYKATQNGQLANDMQRFVQYFGEQVELLEKK